MRAALVVALALAAGASAQPLDPNVAPTGVPPSLEPTMVAPGSTPNEQARFLSGLRVAPGSPLAPLQGAAWYLDHARAYAANWRKFDARYFGPMRAFSATQLTPRIGPVRTLLYLFAGPDFINAYAYFPDAAVYVLGGLEPAGSLVPPEQLDAGRLQAGLENLRASTDVTLSFSHFITKDMKVELERTDFKGVLPILLSFVALGGGEVTQVRAFTAGGAAPALEIRFRKNPAAPEQVLYYLQADLSNDGLKARPAVLGWLRQFAPAVSYLKAASYLMHEPYFSTVRNFLLTESRAILQDDSGIPLRAFPPTGPWQITFFGSYRGTLDIFKKYEQPELDAAYRQMGATPLEFGTGYKWKVGESNLMLAVRQSAAPRPLPVGAASPAGPTAPGTTDVSPNATDVGGGVITVPVP